MLENPSPIPSKFLNSPVLAGSTSNARKMPIPVSPPSVPNKPIESEVIFFLTFLIVFDLKYKMRNTRLITMNKKQISKI
jgi:hypothetical protein